MKTKTTKKNERKQRKRTKAKAIEAVLPPPEQRGLAAYAPEWSQDDPARATATAVRVPLCLIDVPKHIEELPLDMDEVRAIGATVRAGGLIHPISLRPQEAGRHELVTGRHRLEAHKLVGLPDVLALIRTDWDAAGAVVARSVENLRRRRLSPYEEARGYQDMLDHKLSPEAIATACGVSPKTLQERLKLLALPVDVGARLGTREFPLSHGEVLAQLVPYPEHFAVAKKVIGRLDYDDRPLTADGFGDAIAAELRSKRLIQGLDSYAANQRKRRYPAFEKALRKLPTVELGCREFCVDVKAYRKTVAPFMHKDREAKEADDLKRLQEDAKTAAQEPKEESWQEQERRRGFMEAYTAHEHAERISKAARGLLGVDGTLQLVAIEALSGVAREVDADRACVLLADAIGTSPSEVADALSSDEDPKARLHFIERLVQHDDRLPLARFLAVASLLRLEAAWGPEWEQVAKAWLNVESKAFQRDAEKAYKAWVKAGADAPLPGEQVEIEEDQAPPVEAAQEAVAETA